MVVSTGTGGLIAVYTFGCLLASDFSTGRYFPDERYYQDQDGFLRTEDALFFIQARYWRLILCALGVVFYFYKA
jgi:hypothetical protein